MTEDTAPRRRRADAQRNVDTLLDAAKTILATYGVDAPAKQITDLAGLGVGTLYRHFPQRSDLVLAVLKREIDACAAAAPELAAAHDDPVAALAAWLDRYTALIATKQGLAAALQSGGPAHAGLITYFMERMEPAITELLVAALAAGAIRDDVSGADVLSAVPLLCMPVPGRGPEYSRRMVAVLVDGLRYQPPPV
ncbi:TetR/AcrR family transcriptional regulator [Nonomuraea fuscirosea]|uniref:TetR/AcrR family transcriptional regulator n=1 Tax=Nonomuraea fuscirosea TaxID=1291556 RepID=UPI0034275CCF